MKKSKPRNYVAKNLYQRSEAHRDRKNDYSRAETKKELLDELELLEDEEGHDPRALDD